MAEYLDNIVSKVPNIQPIDLGSTLGRVPGASQLAEGFNIPSIPKVENPLKALEGKLPSKELADKAAAKYQELQDKFNNLKKPKVNLKKPKPFKPKEIPIPKKFKKAELENIRGFGEKIGDLKTQATDKISQVKSAAQSIQSQATNLASQVKNAAQSVQSQASSITSQVQNAAQSVQSQLGNISSQLPKI